MRLAPILQQGATSCIKLSASCPAHASQQSVHHSKVETWKGSAADSLGQCQRSSTATLTFMQALTARLKLLVCCTGSAQRCGADAALVLPPAAILLAQQHYQPHCQAPAKHARLPFRSGGRGEISAFPPIPVSFLPQRSFLAIPGVQHGSKAMSMHCSGPGSL